MKLYLIRHPKPEVPADTCYGQLDIGLLPGALESCLDQLPPLPSGLSCVSSPARRCRELAEALLARGDVASLRYDARLKEMNFGDWEGRSWEDIGREAVDAWARNRLDYVVPGGESARQVMARLGRFAEDIAAEGNDCIVISHAGVIRTLLHRASCQAIEDWRFDAPPLAFGSLTIVEI